MVCPTAMGHSRSKQNQPTVFINTNPFDFDIAARSLLNSNHSAGHLVVQVLIVALRASMQSTGCLLTPTLSATSTTLFAADFKAFAKEAKPCFERSVVGEPAFAPQQPVMTTTSGWSDSALREAHAYQAWQ